MSPLTKYEAIGMFSSVAVMALVLSFIRFNTDTFLPEVSTESQNAAGVIVAGEDAPLKDVLTDTVTQNGSLTTLIIEDVKKGNGDMVEEGDTITVNYIGTLRDGTQFDNSYVRGEPFTFTVGAGRVIEGWEKGVVGMQEGGQRVLVIPSHMAYGNSEVGPIPANSPLVFAIELNTIE